MFVELALSDPLGRLINYLFKGANGKEEQRKIKAERAAAEREIILRKLRVSLIDKMSKHPIVNKWSNYTYDQLYELIEKVSQISPVV
ncbi:MAG TPA: hypothetical protein VJY15_02180 [Candidatus Acidoferrum sp.]|nr:hypothetical protein [Candidatus Acidoferrum sp.]